MKFLRMVLGGGPGLTTWFLEGVGQMTIFDHEWGRGVKISEKSDHVVYGWPLKSLKFPKIFPFFYCRKFIIQ